MVKRWFLFVWKNWNWNCEVGDSPILGKKEDKLIWGELSQAEKHRQSSPFIRRCNLMEMTPVNGSSLEKHLCERSDPGSSACTGSTRLPIWSCHEFWILPASCCAGQFHFLWEHKTSFLEFSWVLNSFLLDILLGNFNFLLWKWSFKS